MEKHPVSETGQVRSPRLTGRYKGSVGDFCCVPGCANARGRCNRLGLKLSFYKFPKEDRRRQLWLDRIRRVTVTADGKVQPFEPKSHSRVCSQHIVGGAKVDEPDSAAYIPSIFPRNSSKRRVTKRAKEAGFLITPEPTTKNTRLLEPDAPVGRPKIPRMLDFSSGKLVNISDGNDPKAVWNTTDHDYIRTRCESAIHGQEKSLVPDKTEKLQKENVELKSRLLCLENVKESDEKFQFWTNLPNYAIFCALCEYLKTRTPPNGLNYWKGKATPKTSVPSSTSTSKRPERKFTFEEEFFVVLVKLKTGNFNEDLSHTFGTSPSHISSIFSTWINFLSVELKLLFEMQHNENEKAECYSSFDDLKIVLDCTELMVQKASNMEARKQTFSNYKHHDTVKFLVGISPTLAVNFVSRAWGGI